MIIPLVNKGVIDGANKEATKKLLDVFTKISDEQIKLLEEEQAKTGKSLFDVKKSLTESTVGGSGSLETLGS